MAKKSYFGGLITFETEELSTGEKLNRAIQQYNRNPFYCWSGAALNLWTLLGSGLKLGGELQWVSWWVVIMPSLIHFLLGIKVKGLKITKLKSNK